MKSFPLVLALAALLGFAFAAEAEPARRVRVHYDVSQNGTVMVEATETLEHDGRRYRIRSEWQGKGLFALARRGSVQRTSEGTVDSAGLLPAEFRDRRGDAPAAVARFDWTRRLLVRERDGKFETEPLPDRSQDRLSFVWGFAFAPPSGKEIAVAIADAKGVSHLRYRVTGPERLHTAAGDFDTVRLVKQRDGGDARETEIWLAPKEHYLPLRTLVIEKDGTRIDQVVTRIGG